MQGLGLTSSRAQAPLHYWAREIEGSLRPIRLANHRLSSRGALWTGS